MILILFEKSLATPQTGLSVEYGTARLGPYCSFRHDKFMSNFEIKSLSECDWREYKTIRLESLQDSPDSFGSTYEREISFSPEQWKSRLRIDPTIHHALAIAAVENETFIGLLSSVIHARDTSNAHLYQMWVSPKYRGSGVGTALIDSVRTWASERNVVELALSVTTTNIDAISLYQSIGFTPTGILEPLREGSNLQSQVMQLKLD